MHEFPAPATMLVLILFHLYFEKDVKMKEYAKFYL